MKYFKNISLASLRKRLDSGRALANYLILNELPNAADGMETSKRRDCDLFGSAGLIHGERWNGDLKKKGLRLH